MHFSRIMSIFPCHGTTGTTWFMFNAKAGAEKDGDPRIGMNMNTTCHSAGTVTQVALLVHISSPEANSPSLSCNREVASKLLHGSREPGETL